MAPSPAALQELIYVMILVFEMIYLLIHPNHIVDVDSIKNIFSCFRNFAYLLRKQHHLIFQNYISVQ